MPAPPLTDDDVQQIVQSESDRQPCPHRLSWYQLLARVFSIDVTECPGCGGQMKEIATGKL